MRDRLALLALALAALLLRVRHLDEQILGGDELHLLKVVQEHSCGEILGLVTDTDFSIPLALLARWISGSFPLSEWDLRWPVLLFGSLLPVLLVLGARRFVSPAAAWMLGLLAAGHPFLIFYSRFVRPYGPCLVAVWGVLVLLDAWHRTGKTKQLVGAVLLGVLAGWVHLLAVVAIGWMFLGALLRARVDHRQRVLQGLVLGGLAFLVLVLVVYGPALPGLRDHFLVGTLPKGEVDATVVARNAAVLAGVPSPWGGAALGALALAGLVLLLRGRQSVVWLLVVPLVGLPLTVLLQRPYLLQFSMVLARYVIYVLPIALLLACLALRALLRRDTVAVGVMFVFVTLSLVFGPYRTIYDGRSAYAHDNAFQTFDRERDPRWASGKEPPDFYRSELFREATGLLLEGPAPEGFLDNVLVCYQDLHGRPMKAFTTDDTFWGSERLDLQNTVVLRAGERPELDALVVVHKNARREVRRLTGEPASSRSPQVYGPEVVERLVARLDEIAGAPVYEDEDVRVYRLEAGS